MELKIISPQESGFLKEIQWNHEEAKAYILEKTAQYKGLVFTEAEINDAKKDRAKLRKFKNAFEDERKRIKKLCLEPYEKFEKQVKEIIELIEEPIRMIDVQIKEVEENKKEQKRKEIEELFKDIGFQPFVTLEQIFDSRWLNVSVSLNNIKEQMESRMYQIGNDVLSINQLPEFSFEAMEIYKSTLDIGQAIQEGRRLSEIQKQKAAYEAEQKRLQEETQEKKAVAEMENQQRAAEEMKTAEIQEAFPVDTELQKERLVTIDFRVTATNEQLTSLKKFLIENRITYGPVPKGE